MKLIQSLAVLLVTIFAIAWAAPAWAFCGFYVAKADSSLYNKASQVVIARNGDRTILTMANDYQGSIKDFAVVIPVPVVLKKEQVHVSDPKIVERLDAFSAPRLVEYFDPNPCDFSVQRQLGSDAAPAALKMAEDSIRSRSLGVTVEAQFSVGEYDIVILSAKESNGLATWLRTNGYKIPKGASPLLQPYIRQGMKFFVAKVNLANFQKSGFQYLRPLQIAYASPRFMLPIRLGMINANGVQDLLVYVLSPKGQAEVTNYRTVKVPSDAEIPVFVKQEFGDFYKAMFQTAYGREGRNATFLEYAWDMSNCDPCSAEPLNPEELRKAGVFWLDAPEHSIAPSLSRPPLPGPQGVFITRLHVRYTRDKFPEDLMFQETANRDSFQGRYVLRHAYSGEMNCSAGRQYQRSLPKRLEAEVQALAKLTNWNIQDIRKKAKVPEDSLSNSVDRFWRSIWPQ
jgi:hypothetical protein